MRHSLTICLAWVTCLTACSTQQSAKSRIQVQPDAFVDGTSRPSVDAGPELELIKPPERVRSVYPEAVQTKRAWARRMLLERRFPKELCASDAYLLNCIETFRNPETRILGRFSKRDCMNAVDDIVGKELSSGGKSKGLTGAFFGDDLPPKLKVVGKWTSWQTGSVEECFPFFCQQCASTGPDSFSRRAVTCFVELPVEWMGIEVLSS